MAKNDRILVDQLVTEAAQEEGADIGEAFQIWALSQLLKDLDLSKDEILAGIVDGRDDGGIDAWYTFLDNELMTDPADVPHRRSASTIEVRIFTAKHHDTFRQDTVVAIASAVRELMDLSRGEADLSERYNAALIGCRALLKETLVRTARGNPRLRLVIHYVSRGDSSNVGSSIRVRSDALVRDIQDLFSNCDIAFAYAGSAELLAASRRLKSFAAVLRFEEGPISRGATNYIGLAKLTDYARFVSDDEGGLRRHLFESNVRDYMGRTPANESIRDTLRRLVAAAEEDFWWLNNGVTIIADRAGVVGKELHLENVCIVNGLQTTESIFHRFSEQRHDADDRCVLVKVLVTSTKELADKIILATNNQNKVDQASLRATDKVQRDIEDVLRTRDWFYDRRKNYYLNQGKPVHRIVSMNYVGWSIQALRLGQPFRANRARPKYMRTQRAYSEVFQTDRDIHTYLAAVEICKRVEEEMIGRRLSIGPYVPRNFAMLFRFLYSHLYCISVLKGLVTRDQDLIIVQSRDFDPTHLDRVHECVTECWLELARRNSPLRKLHRSAEFDDMVRSRLLSILQRGNGSEAGA